MLFFHACKNEGLILDIQQDKKIFNDVLNTNKQTALIMLGGGLIKHNVLKSLLNDKEFDMGVFVTTAMEYDGSFSGSRI